MGWESIWTWIPDCDRVDMGVTHAARGRGLAGLGEALARHDHQRGVRPCAGPGP